MKYNEVLTKSFYQSYLTNTDLWSNDDGLTNVAIKLVNQLLCIGSQHNILDIGTGNGRHAELFVRNGWGYTGIDLYKHPDWEEQVTSNPQKVRFIHSSFLEWETDDVFTAILDNGCFHHQSPEQDIAYLKKIHEILDENGIFVMGLYPSVDTNVDTSISVMPSGKYRRVFSPKGIHDLLKTNGFSCYECGLVKSAGRNRDYLYTISKKSN